ncbi:D(3) dopamine receptor isoform X1 [Echeneis naucrates]|uniref:D(3) dopamine receptor n=1 Tax=Echeneis naucrates TaxID=173247 RepID=A0A665V4Q0_ECHNA|nr:D(3) dopamine receptor isoform X1 [Echeneis naucrates]XP_029385427.1 D(3) dopamine receptor isoform X1 [Echeneis naucrates]
MAMFSSAERLWNESDPLGFDERNDSEASGQDEGELNYYAMLYSLLILAIVFGNVLVCLAVLRERSLQTTTNYLVVSLAVSDLLVASLVMPWVVYLEVVGGAWLFSRLYCNIFVTLDVMMCTASILNLCAISIDRYTAVVMPVLYNTTHRSRKRVFVMIAIVWFLAFAVSCPLLFGFNTTDDPLVCSISNPDFVIYSSVVSFYLPFFVTLLVYIRIYIFLRMRRKRITFSQASGKIRPGSTPPSVETCLQEETPKAKQDLSPIRINVQSVESSGNTKPNLLSRCLWRKRPKTGPVENSVLPPVDTQNNCSISHASCGRTELDLEQEQGEEEVEDNSQEQPPIRMNCEVKNLSNGRTHTSLRTLAHSHTTTQRFRSMHAREKKATQMLAIVLGVFLICWLPFFVTHILNTHCRTCYVPPALYGAFTWLGYVNSALNPVIYTTFNIEFRRAFIKILSC